MNASKIRTFDELCQLLESAPFEGDGSASFGIPARTDGYFFVAPVLLEKDDQEDPSVTLISARGAAGKSTMAVELAFRLKVPLWRLELDKAVSGTSLDFALGQYLKSHDVSEQIAGRRSPTVIIDSLDEARARVSGVSWTEFVESLGRLAQCGLRYVLLGRERTLEDVWVALSELDLTVAWREISHFAPDQCPEYVDGVVALRDPTADCSSDEYRSARDALIGSLRSAAVGTYAEEFVGYAPVLDAAAAMLIKKPNLLTIRQRFENVGAQDRVALLGDILRKLLERDQEKVGVLVKELGIDPEKAYSPDEQVKWLCYFLEDSGLPDLSYISSPSARQKYVEQISIFADEHPFRSEAAWASPVFEAFVASVEFDQLTFSSARLIEIGHKSGFLLDFMNGKNDLIITEAQFAALHASIIASEVAESMTSVVIAQVADDSYSGAFAVNRVRERARVTTFCLVPEVTGTLEVLGPLAELSIQARDAVVVPGRPQGTVLGPDLFISASMIRIGGPALEFSRRPDSAAPDAGEPSVIIEARESLHLPSVSPQLPPQNEFEIRVPHSVKLRYPWFEYGSELVSEETPSEKVVRFLNKLMNLTRNHGHTGERGVFIKKLEGRQPLRISEFNSALGVLRAEKVVRVDADMVFVREEWEAHRYSGKALKGQRQLADVMDAWGSILAKIEDAISRG
ncbi:MAG: hypothetical protein LH624_13470 [Cryobacterium sp.]|nr:hypothetical protein [Cryobacterium sp.]